MLDVQAEPERQDPFRMVYDEEAEMKLDDHRLLMKKYFKAKWRNYANSKMQQFKITYDKLEKLKVETEVHDG